MIAALTWSLGASATSYYVSSSAGSDSNSGTSSAAPWQTVGHVNGQAFQPGDQILFRRGDTWNESLVPPSSGVAGSPITFDSYGTGPAPNLTGYYSVPSSAWVLVSGNAWKAPLPASYTTINFCLFGSIWGQKVAASSSNLLKQWDFYFANGFVYVFAAGNPGSYYNAPIVPMALSNTSLINVNGKSRLTFQHFLLNWFDQYGVYVLGASDHLVFANMEADSMIPQGTQPLGFYVNESAPGPGDIKFYDVEAHLNYDGFRFDGAATAITMINDKAYANRDGALVDNTGVANFSHCHFYASSLAVAGSTDVEWTTGNGPAAGAGNIAADTPPVVQAYQRYPARVTLTVDDAGMTPGADTYYANTVLPIADAASVPVGVAITVGYPLANTLVSEFQGWINAGRDVTSHSMSHTYYTNTDALDIQYTGSGTAATLSISNKTLTITVTGAADSVNYNLAQGQAQGTIQGLRQALQATGKFTASEAIPCQGAYGTGCSAYTEAALLAQDLADVSNQDVKTSVYATQLDVTRLTTDEITLSRQWMTSHLTGLPANPVFVYPGGYETTAMQGIAAAVPYIGARGALKEDLGVKDTYASGFNVQNITSFGVNPTWQGLQASALNQRVQALLWKQAVWGVPWGVFWHLNELTTTEVTNLINDFKNWGATITTNTGLANWLLSGTQGSGASGSYYYKSPATSMTLDFRPTKNSPVVDAGQNLGAAYQIDINGVNQNAYGSAWEIGAHTYVPFSTYGTNQGSSYFDIGAPPCGPPNYCAYSGTDIVQWPALAPDLGGLTKNNAIVYDTSYVAHGQSASLLGRVSRCTDALFSPGRDNVGYAASEGGSGSGLLWNTNSTLVHVNVTTGTQTITLFNPTTMVCGDPTTGKAITQDKNLTHPGSALAIETWGNGGFSLSDPTIYYQYDTNSDVPSTNMQVVPFAFNTSNGNFTVGSPVADFALVLPLGSNAPSWQASHAYGYGAYISHALTSSEYLAWNATSTSYVIGDLIKPGAGNNPAGCAFKLTQTGTTGSVEPAWGSSCNLSTLTDGTAKWRGINSTPSFVYQLTTVGGGTSGASTPTFVATPGHPDLVASVSDNGMTWMNVGPNYVVPSTLGWKDWGGTSRDSTKFTEAFSSETYGYSGNYTYNGGQGSGIWTLEYDQTANIYHLLNTLTGIQSDVSCSGGSGYNCSGGSFVFTVIGQPASLANCGFVIHNIKASNDGTYINIKRQGSATRGTCPVTDTIWRPLQAFNAATQVQFPYASLAHWALGKSHLFDIGNAVYGGSSGVYAVAYDLSNPSAQPPAYWQASPCSATPSGGVYNPPSCDISKVIDNHLSTAYNPGDTDTFPVCGSVTNSGNSSTVAFNAWQGEEVCMSTSPTWSDTTNPSPSQKQWRFSHCFNTGTNSAFDAQFCLSEMAQDGRFLAFTSDWNSLLGSTTGSAPVLPISNPAVICLGGYQWTASTPYTLETLIHPVGGTTGSGAVFHVYQAVSITTGTSGSSTPNWASTALGGQIVDGGVTWQDLGPGNCRSDVMIVELK